MNRRPQQGDPIVDLLLAADLPGIASRAEQRAARLAAERSGDVTGDLATAWKILAEVCRG